MLAELREIEDRIALLPMGADDEVECSGFHRSRHRRRAACQRVNPRRQPATLPSSYTTTGDTTRPRIMDRAKPLTRSNKKSLPKADRPPTSAIYGRDTLAPLYEVAKVL